VKVLNSGSQMPIVRGDYTLLIYSGENILPDEDWINTLVLKNPNLSLVKEEVKVVVKKINTKKKTVRRKKKSD